MNTVVFQVPLIASIVFLFVRTHKKVPYFPIEISRCAESEPWILQWVSMAIGLFVLVSPSWTLALFWLALSVISYWDDKDYWEMHMFGVALLGIYYFITCSWLQLACMAIVYGCRILLKVFALVILEDCPRDLGSLKEYGLHIMYTGKTCHPNTRHIFRLCGVFQWICFFIGAF